MDKPSEGKSSTWFSGPITMEEIKARHRKLLESALNDNNALSRKIEKLTCMEINLENKSLEKNDSTNSSECDNVLDEGNFFIDLGLDLLKNEDFTEYEICEKTNKENLLEFENLLDRGNFFIDLGLNLLKKKDEKGNISFTKRDKINFRNDMKGQKILDVSVQVRNDVACSSLQFKQLTEISTGETNPIRKMDGLDNYDSFRDLLYGEISSIPIKERSSSNLVQNQGEKKSIDRLNCSLNIHAVKNETSLITTMTLSFDGSNSPESDICREINWRLMKNCSLRDHNLPIQESSQGSISNDVFDPTGDKSENILRHDILSILDVSDNIFENCNDDLSLSKNKVDIEFLKEVVEDEKVENSENVVDENEALIIDAQEIVNLIEKNSIENELKSVEVVSVSLAQDEVSKTSEKIESIKSNNSIQQELIDEIKFSNEFELIPFEEFDENESIENCIKRKSVNIDAMSEMLDKQFSEFCESIKIKKSFDSHSTAQNSFSDHFTDLGNVKNDEIMSDQKTTLIMEKRKTIGKISKKEDALSKKITNSDRNKTLVDISNVITINDSTIMERALNAVRLLNDVVSTEDKNKNPLKFSNNGVASSSTSIAQSDSVKKSLLDGANESGFSRILGDTTGSNQSLLAMSSTFSPESTSFGSVGQPESIGTKQFMFATPASLSLKKNNVSNVKSTLRSIRKPLNYFTTPPSIRNDRKFAVKNTILPQIIEKKENIGDPSQVEGNRVNTVLSSMTVNKENVSIISTGRKITDKNIENVSKAKSFSNSGCKRKFFGTPLKVRNNNGLVLQDLKDKMNTEIRPPGRPGIERSYGQWTARKVYTDEKSKKLNPVSGLARKRL